MEYNTEHMFVYLSREISSLIFRLGREVNKSGVLGISGIRLRWKLKLSGAIDVRFKPIFFLLVLCY